MIMSIHVGRASTYPSTMFYTLQCVYKWDKTKMISIKTGYSLKRYPLKEVWLYSDCICFFSITVLRWNKAVVCVCQFSVRHGTGSLAHRVNGSFGSSFTSGSPGVRPKFCRFSKKCQKCKMYIRNDKSHCQVSVVGLKSLDVSLCNELLLLPMIIKNS